MQVVDMIEQDTVGIHGQPEIVSITDSAMTLLTALRERRVSASELLEAAIERTEYASKIINPIAVKLYDRARRSAKEADRRLAEGNGGPLCGLPITIKDSQWLAGVPCANGSHALKFFIPDHSSAAVTSLEEAGAVIFAKTTCPEFSLFGITDSALYGTTSNPWNILRTSGGSSGGAAAAVAAGLGPLSLGGDGGGSIRIPSAFCGIVGFKPSFGLVDRAPCFPSWKSLVCYGPMARSVADARLMLSVLTPQQDHIHAAIPVTRSLAGQKIIVSEDLGFAPVDDDVRFAFRALVDRLSDAGAEIVEDNPGLTSSVETWAITATYDAWVHHEEADNTEGIGEFAQGFIQFGSQFSAGQFEEAQRQRRAIAEAYEKMFERTGSRTLLTPTLGCEAFPHGRVFPEKVGDTAIELPWTDWAGFLYDANLTGKPACALPIGTGDEGLPLSVQVLGPTGADMEVLDTAERIEALADWRHVFAGSDELPVFPGQ